MIPYQILEIANTHGGSQDYVLALINEFEEYKGFGMKFQPLHPDRIATSDFAWYNVYQQLMFDHTQWTTILEAAHRTKDIWLDLFDTYGVDIFRNNKSIVKGLKLQSSVLYNESVLQELKAISLKGHLLIINISGLEIPEIRERLSYFGNLLQPDSIWIEVGFQAYPTELQDSGYVKIGEIRKHFANKIVFADHADGKGEDAIWLPLVAAMNGADVIEKHVMHGSLETKYDHFSSITPTKYADFISKLKAYTSLNNQEFINQREHKYLAGTIQIPITKHGLKKGTLVDPIHDLEYKRSGKSGLNARQLRELQQQMHVLAIDVPAGETLKKEHFKKATIATIVACRLKSSRLEKKAILKIGELPSVERCLKSCMNFKHTQYTILATSDLESDADLSNYTYSPSVIFHKGDPEDVIHRYLGIIDQMNIDIIIRITADMPYVSSEIAELLLADHFRSGADYTAARNSAVGTSVEIINTASLRKVKEHFKSADYSEYMTWYFQNNPEHFKLNIVDLPEAYIRNYRLTLDYQEDLDLFNNIEQHLVNNKLEPSISNIFTYLDDNPEVAGINGHLTLKYKTDPQLIETLNRVTKINA